jgi:hypothetical protein
MDCNIAELHYGQFKAVRDVAVKFNKGTITSFYRTLRMRQEHSAAMPQPDE